MPSELFVLNENDDANGANEGGFTTLEIMAPNYTPLPTADTSVTTTELDDGVHVSATEVKLVQVMALDMPMDEGNTIVSLADAGSAGVCFNLMVYVVLWALVDDSLVTAMDVMVDAVSICTDIPVSSCSIPYELL